MRYSLLSAATAVVALAVSCTVSQPELVDSPVVNEQEITITATSGEPDTRTERAADGSVLWSPGDQISLFYGNGSAGGSCFTAQNAETAKTVNFTGTIGVITGGNNIAVEDTYFWAVYPYNSTASCDGNSITTVLPAEQVATADTFADDLFPSMGRSQGLNMAFYNICGGIKFTITKEMVKSVTLAGLNGEKLAGRIRVGYNADGMPTVLDITESAEEVVLSAGPGAFLEVGKAYYFVIPPTTFQNGLKLTFRTSMEEGVREISKPITIRRSIFGTLSNADTGIEWTALTGNIPLEDPVFKQYLVSRFDQDGDGEISYAEAESATIINVSTNNIHSLQGIECMPNLQYLYCRGSHGQSVDNTEKGGCLSSLVLNNNPNLRYLVCDGNHIKKLDLNRLENLVYFNASYNDLTALDVTHNIKLEQLRFYNNQVSEIDLSNNVNLTQVHVNYNNLSSLEIPSGSKLQSLFCHNNNIATLDLSPYTNLLHLSCRFNQLSTIDLSANTLLEDVKVSGNSINSLDLSHNPGLTYIGMAYTDIESVDLSNNPALTELHCDCSALRSLDLSHNPEMSVVYGWDNQIEQINLEGANKLRVLRLSNNKFSSIDLSGKSQLDTLEVDGNLLSSLDVSSCQNLKALNCYSNMLTHLDVSQNTALASLCCSPMADENGSNLLEYLYVSDGQQIQNVTVDRNNEYVPDETTIVLHCVPIPDENFRAYMIQNFDTNGNGVLDFDEAEEVSSIDVNTQNISSLAGIEYCPNLTILKCHGNTSYWNSNTNEFVGCGQLTSLDISNNTSLVQLHCYSNKLTSLDVSANPLLLEIFCYGNKLSSLDVTPNQHLVDLNCSLNQLSSLDLSNNNNLLSVSCYRNQLTNLVLGSNSNLWGIYSDNNRLTSIDLSSVPNLEVLYCSYNNLSSLDLSKNESLTNLGCYWNQLTTLDLSHNPNMEEVACSTNQLTSLDVSHNTQLTSLLCNNNNLSTLDVGNNTQLLHLNCSANSLEALNLEKNVALVSLDCHENLVTTLRINQNTALNSLDCSPMNDAGGNNLLEYLYIAQGQQITGVTVDRSSDYVPEATIVMVAPESGGSEGTNEEPLD